MILKKLLLFVMTVFILTACSSDENNDNSIIGYWEFTKESAYQIVSTNPESTKKIKADIKEDEDNGTSWAYETDGKCYEYDGHYIYPQTYKVKGNMLELRWYEEWANEYRQEIYKYVISGNTMVIYHDETEYYPESKFPGVTKVITAFKYIRTVKE